jgi:hypothetical protein
VITLHVNLPAYSPETAGDSFTGPGYNRTCIFGVL